MIIIVSMVLAFIVVFGANAYLCWTLARIGKKKLMHIILTMMSLVTIYLIVMIICIYKNLISL